MRYRDDELPDTNPDGATEMPSLEEKDLRLLKAVGRGPYSVSLEQAEKYTRSLEKEVDSTCGVAETDTGIAPRALWNVDDDLRILEQFQPRVVARVQKILGVDQGAAPRVQTSMDRLQEQAQNALNPSAVLGKLAQAGEAVSMPTQRRNAGQWRAVITLRQTASFVVSKDPEIAETDIDEGMRVAVDRGKMEIKVPLPVAIDAAVSLMQVEDKTNVTYDDIGGCKKQLKLIREALELPLLHPERFTAIGVQPAAGLLFYGAPGSGKTLTARAVANRTNSTFIRVLGSELVCKYVGEGAKLVREIFSLARTKKSCIIFFDEVDSFALKRSVDAQETGDSGVQRTMLELIAQLDGFSKRGNVKVIMATNRPDTLDEAILRPGRLDKKIEFGLPDEAGRAEIFEIYLRKMSVDKDIRTKLLARLTPSCSGAEIRSICTEAGMFCLRERRRVISEGDFLKAIDKVVKGYKKFVSEAKYLIANNV